MTDSDTSESTAPEISGAANDSPPPQDSERPADPPTAASNNPDPEKKKRQRRGKGKGKSAKRDQATDEGDGDSTGDADTDDDSDTARIERNQNRDQSRDRDSTRSSGPSRSSRSRSRRKPKPPAPPSSNTKLDPTEWQTKAWKLFLADVCEEGTAMFDDQEANHLARRSFEMAAIFLRTRDQAVASLKSIQQSPDDNDAQTADDSEAADD